MSFLMVAGGLALVAFMLAYIRQGRFGPAALALMAGYTLAMFWADTVATTYKSFGEGLGISLWRDAVYAGFIAVPALLVLLISPKRKSIIPRVVGALAFGALAVTLLVPIFALVVFSDSTGSDVYKMIDQNKQLIMTIVLVLALIDVLFSGASKSPRHARD